MSYIVPFCAWHECTNKDLPTPKPLFKCSRCSYTPYCSKSCQKLDWKRHKNFCAPQSNPFNKDASDKNTLFFHAVEREFTHFIWENANQGESALASRSALRLGHKNDLRKEKFLHVSFEYCGPLDLTVSTSRADIPRLRSHFKFLNATVEPFSPWLDRSLIRHEFARKRMAVHMESVGGEDNCYSYIIGSTLTIPNPSGGAPDVRTDFTFPNFQTDCYLPFISRDAPEPIRKALTFGKIAINKDWLNTLRKHFEKELEEGEGSRARFMRMVATELGFDENICKNVGREWEEILMSNRKQ